MDSRLYERSLEELDDIQRAAQEFVVATDSRTATRHWLRILNGLQRLYNKLLAGAKGNAKSTAWAEAKLHERRTDELLRYLNQARHVDEHGLGEVTETAFSVSLAARGRGMHVNSFALGADGKTVTLDAVYSDDGSTVPFDDVVSIEYMTLVPVRNRGVLYPVPSTHRGQPINNTDLGQIAQMIVRHAMELAHEASQLVR